MEKSFADGDDKEKGSERTKAKGIFIADIFQFEIRRAHFARHRLCSIHFADKRFEQYFVSFAALEK